MNKGEYYKNHYEYYKNHYFGQLYEMTIKIAEMQERVSDMKDQVEEMRTQILKDTRNCVFTGTPSTFNDIDDTSWDLKELLNDLEQDYLYWIDKAIKELSGEINDLDEEDY